MAGIWGAFGEPGFGLNDGKLDTFVTASSYGGSPIDIPSIRVLEWTQEFQTAVLEGDDRITASASRIIRGGVTLTMGGIAPANLAVLAMILGLNVGTGGTGDTAYAVLRVKSPTPCYVALCGRALNAEGGDGHLFLPKIMVTGISGIRMEFGAFSMPEMTFDVLDDGGDIGFGEIVLHKVAKAVTIGPVYDS
jgi:hypothetical protein